MAAPEAPRRGRPRGEVRKAIADAVRWYAAQRMVQPLKGLDGQPLAGATWPELMQRACVSWDDSAQTIKDMVRGRELLKLGRTVAQGYTRPLTVYAPAAELDPAWAKGWASVQEAMAAMCRQHR